MNVDEIELGMEIKIGESHRNLEMYDKVCTIVYNYATRDGEGGSHLYVVIAGENIVGGFDYSIHDNHNDFHPYAFEEGVKCYNIEYRYIIPYYSVNTGICKECTSRCKEEGKEECGLYEPRE